MRVGVEVRAEEPEPGWARVDPEGLVLQADERRPIRLHVNPPPETPAGGYPFSIRVHDVADPAQVFAQGLPVTAVMRRKHPKDDREHQGNGQSRSTRQAVDNRKPSRLVAALGLATVLERRVPGAGLALLRVDEDVAAPSSPLGSAGDLAGGDDVALDLGQDHRVGAQFALRAS